MILMASCAMVMTGCKGSKEKDSKKEKPEEEQMLVTEESLEYTELKKVQLPCAKDSLYNEWKQIGVIELQRKKTLDYKQHTPLLYLSTDLDDDGNPEVLLRGEPPYAAIYTFIKDSLKLLTYVDQAEMGLAITPDGTILRNGRGQDGSTVSEFIQLEGSRPVASGAIRETFVIKNNKMVSGATHYMLQTDSALVEVNREAYEKVAPQQAGTYLEELDGWEDFRKP